MTSKDEERAALAERLPERCPGCKINWRMFPPVNHEDAVLQPDGKSRFAPTNGYRCVECKREYRIALSLVVSVTEAMDDDAAMRKAARCK